MRRRVLTWLSLSVALAAACPAVAASKEVERLQIQMATLQSQFAEFQRNGEETLRELKRLNEILADQSVLIKKLSQDQRVSDEAVTAAVRELSEKLGEVREIVAALRTGGPSLDTPAASPSGASAGGPAPAGGGPAAPPPAPRELYNQAYGDYARGNYDLAIAAFQEYLRAYPNTDFTDNAQYWIGECLYGKAQYQDAIEAFNTLFRDFPSSDKLPDGRVKKGMALERLGRRSQALQEYRYVMERFPNSSAARVAREKLNP